MELLFLLDVICTKVILCKDSTIICKNSHNFAERRMLVLQNKQIRYLSNCKW